LRTNHSSFRKKGMSTVLGTIIFIGILFSAVIPMFLVMQQADIILDQEKLEIRRVDDEKSREAMDVYAYPVEDESQIEIKVNSRCELPIDIVHLWINNTMQDIDVTLEPMEQEKTLGPYDIPAQAGTNSEFSVKFTTARGNVYESKAGLIIYDGEDGWQTPDLQIIAMVGSQGSFWFGLFGSYKATLTRDSPAFSETQTKTWTMGICMFQFDVTECGPGTYHLLVQRKAGSWWNPTWSTIYDEDVALTWPSGPSIVEIYI